MYINITMRVLPVITVSVFGCALTDPLASQSLDLDPFDLMLVNDCDEVRV